MRRTALIAAFVFFVTLTTALAAEPKLTVLSVDGGVTAVAAAADGIRVQTGAGMTRRLNDTEGTLSLLPTMVVPESWKPRAQMLPDGEVTQGTHNIAQAWLIGPTERYDHGVLGDAVEATGIRVVLSDLWAAQFKLPADSVFEDRYPRLADVNGDGRDEILLVRSYLEEGATLAVLEADREGVRIMAQTPALGIAHRWLNPVGAADFDNDGIVEMSYVETPHIGGVLRLWSLQSGGMAEEFNVPGFSNHVAGRPNLGMSAVVDVNGDGVPDIVAPSADRKALRAVTFVGGKVQNVFQLALPSPTLTDIAVDGKILAVGLEDGRLAVVSF